MTLIAIEILWTLFMTWIGYQSCKLVVWAVGSLAAGLFRMLTAGRRRGEISPAPATGRRPSRLAPVSCR